jgi:hypothetical protein
MNSSLDQGQSALDGLQQLQWLTRNGLDGTAEVLAITETGRLVNMNPVFMLSVKVQPAMIAVAFETNGQAMVSRFAIPHVGDKLKIKYNPADPTQFVVL